MSFEPTEDRIRDLARGLVPVRPIPRLRTAFAVGLSLWLLVAAADWMLGGYDLRSSTSWLQPGFMAPLVGLILVAFGATTAALTGAIPGREASERAGLIAAALGLVLAIGAGTLQLLGESTSGVSIRSCFSCLGRSTLVGIPSVLLCCAFVVYAAVRSARAAAALALAGGVALGAVAVHVSCPMDSALHRLVGHILPPLAAVVLLAVPLAGALQRASHRSDASD